MPRYDGSTMDFLLQELQFEVDTCALVQRVPAIVASRIVDYRAPVQSAAPHFGMPKDIAGRRLMIFEKAEGEHNVWRNLSPDGKVHTQFCFLSAFLPCSGAHSSLRPLSLGLPAFSGSSNPRVPVHP